MPKFIINVSTDIYWRYVVEADDVTQAHERAWVDWENSLERLTPTIEVTETDDDAEVGDV